MPSEEVKKNRRIQFLQAFPPLATVQLCQYPALSDPQGDMASPILDIDCTNS